jgi:hypothetical protein
MVGEPGAWALAAISSWILNTIIPFLPESPLSMGLGDIMPCRVDQQQQQRYSRVGRYEKGVVEAVLCAREGPEAADSMSGGPSIA